MAFSRNYSTFGNMYLSLMFVPSMSPSTRTLFLPLLPKMCAEVLAGEVHAVARRRAPSSTSPVPPEPSYGLVYPRPAPQHPVPSTPVKDRQNSPSWLGRLSWLGHGRIVRIYVSPRSVAACRGGAPSGRGRL